MSNVFGLKGSYTFANGTRYYSTPGIDPQDNTPIGKPVIGNAAAQNHTDIVDEVGESPYPMESRATTTSPSSGDVVVLPSVRTHEG